MISQRKSKNSGLGEHSEHNPLRSNKLNTKMARKPTRTGSPSRDRDAFGSDDEGQDVALQSKNLQEEPKAERAAHSRTAEIRNAPLVKREAA